jgi:predicted TIM-barrel fold metal-dependent hydrolase
MNRREFNIAALTVLGFAALCRSRVATAADPDVTAVDTHAHVFHRGLTFIPERRYTPEYDALPEEYLALLDAKGMSHGVIIPISILGTDNSYTVEVLKQAQGRLRGLAVVDPETDLGTLDDLAGAGIVGIRMNLAGGRPIPDVTGGAWKELVDEVKARDWHVEVYDDASRLPDIVAPLLASDAKVVVDHFGKPDPALGVKDPGFQFLLGTAGSEQVWVKLSAPYRSSLETAAQAAPLLLERFGPQRLLWGSDWPFTNFEDSVRYEDMRALLDVWVPNPEQRRTILADTPAALYLFRAKS